RGHSAILPSHQFLLSCVTSTTPKAIFCAWNVPGSPMKSQGVGSLSWPDEKERAPLMPARSNYGQDLLCHYSRPERTAQVGVAAQHRRLHDAAAMLRASLRRARSRPKGPDRDGGTLLRPRRTAF